jgi:hypothetical protein
MHRNNPENDDFQLVFGAPCQLQSLAGQEHGRIIPLLEADCASQQSKQLRFVRRSQVVTYWAAQEAVWPR